MEKGGNIMNKNCLIRKGIVVGILTLFLGLSVIPSNADIYEKDTIPTGFGDILYVGGGGQGNHSTIQEAIDNSSHGDTIYVYDDSSPYYENLQVDRMINLIGESKETTVIDGGGTNYVINLLANMVNVSGFTISGGYAFNAAIVLTTNSNKIQDNIIANNNCTAISITGDYNTITLNDISDNLLNGIQISNAEFNTISENTIDSNDIGVSLDEASNNTITGNTISNNLGDGIYLTSGSDYLTISFNNITDNLNNGIYSSWNEYCTIQGNTIANNGEVNQSGIYLTASSYCEIIENTIDGNNEYGLQLILWCNQNVIRRNNFMNNDVHAIFFTSALNIWSFNYWDRPRIFPKPIFGIMGIMPWINFDWRPLLTPV